jgi:hypothetical protein
MPENTSTDALTKQEQTTLAKCETTIKKGLKSFIEVGNALAEIRDSRLYRQEFSSFKAYLNAKWPIKLSRAYQLIGAAEVARNVSTIVDASQLKESHVRNLVRKPSEFQRKVILKCRERAGGRPFTARTVREAVREITPRDLIRDVVVPPPELRESAARLGESLDGFKAVTHQHRGCTGFIVETLEKVRKDALAMLKEHHSVLN